MLLVEFAVLEGSLRLAGGSEAGSGFQSLFMDDARVGRRLKPGAHTRYTTVEFSTDIRINAQGVRDDRDLPAKASDERRVLVLGDSLVLSVQVPLEQTFCRRLEERLSAADPRHRWRVINGGSQGYGPVDEWLFFRNVAETFQADVVMVVAFVGNDAVDAYEKAARLDAGGALDIRPIDAAANSIRRLTRASMVLQFARVRLDQLRARLTARVGERPLTTYLADAPDEVLHGLEVTRRAYGLIAARAAELGGRSALVLMPARFQVEDADYARLAAAVASAGGQLVRNAGSERFRAALEPLKLPMLDLLPVLERQPDRAGLFFQRNVHLTPRGHQVVADALFDFLQRHGLTTDAAARRP